MKDGILAIVKGEKKGRESSGETEMPEDDSEGGAFAEAADRVAAVLGVPQGKRAEFRDALESAIYACTEE